MVKAIKEGRKPTAGGIGEEEVVAPINAINIAPAPTVNNGGYDIPNAPSSLPVIMPPTLPMPGYTPPPTQPVQYQPPPSYQQPPQQHHNPVPTQTQNYASTNSYPSAAPSAPSLSTPSLFSNKQTNGLPPKNANDPRANDCIELCQFAIAAIKHNDIPLAKQRLLDALLKLE